MGCNAPKRQNNIKQQSEQLDQQMTNDLVKIVYFLRKRSEKLANMFEDQLFQNYIQTHDQLVKVVKEGQFPEFRSLYYIRMSKQQQNKFDDEYQNLLLEQRQEIKYSYQIHNSQNRFNAEKDFYLLVLGVTGSGKTKFINSLCSVLTLDPKQSYLESVKQILVDDNHLQKTGSLVTTKIQKYSIQTNHKNKCFRINIIDTPGLNNTAGIKQDHMMVSILLNKINQLEDLLLKELPHLDLILFVSKEQETYNQQERISIQSVVKLLGIDSPKYTKQILTFSELSKNINEDKFKDKLLQLCYEKQTEPKYYQFQNSLMSMEGAVSHLDTLRLQRNLKNYKMFMGDKFFTKPCNDYLDLQQTKKVIQFRRQIRQFNNQIIEEIQQNQKEIELLEVEKLIIRQRICTILVSIRIINLQLRKSALFYEYQNDEFEEDFFNEIEKQYGDQIKIVTEVKRVRELYQKNKEFYQAKAKQQMEWLEKK